MGFKIRVDFTFLLLLFCIGINAHAQQPYFRNYNINDGLVSNKIYNVTEDRSGFIWICSDLGVSRFDGISFVNFTTKDGLPDNEILGLFEDNVGRIWFNGYGTEPCYYFNGKIFNAGNDSFIKRVKAYKLNGLCLNVFVQENNSIAYLIQQNGKTLLIGKDIKDICIKRRGSMPGVMFQHILIRKGDEFRLQTALETIYWKKDDSVSKVETYLEPYQLNYTKADKDYIYSLNPKTHVVEKYDIKTEVTIKFQMPAVYDKLFVCEDMVALAGDSCYAIYDKTFTTLVNSSSLNFNFARILVDRRGNKWMGSFDNGIYFIRENPPYNIPLPVGKRKGILSVVPVDDRLYINTEKNGLMFVDTSGNLTEVLNAPHMNRILGFAQLGNKGVIGSDDGLYLMDMLSGKVKLLFYSAIKDIEWENGDKEVLISMASGAGIFENDSFQSVDDVRITAICRANENEIWSGGLKGLRKSIKVGEAYVARDFKLNELLDNSRIVDIKKDKKGNMWVATSQGGLFFCPVKGPVIRFHEHSEYSQRLISNFCLELVVAKDNGIWLASAGGVSAIRYWEGSKTSFSVSNYSIPEGMPGKTIRHIAFWNNRIVLATPNGLTYFTTFPLPQTATSETLITRVKVNGTDYYNSDLVLPYQHNSLIISYASSFINSGMEYRFKYRVKELSDKWIETNTLEVPLLGLEAGKYNFEITAINEHGDAGKITTLSFTILTPWFRQWWFYALLTIAVVLIVLYLYRLIKEKINLGKNLTLFRLRILRAQMNPHFVFNALSNIQHLIQIKQLHNASRYIGTLSSIMRKSIEYSGKEFIQLEKEINYTVSYLQIEKMRFEDKFDYTFITALSQEEKNAIYVPPLVLQPIVENAIKHAFKGIQYKGQIVIMISKLNNDMLRYVISDNGCGFDYVGSSSEIHGLDITRERLAILYKGYRYKGEMKIESGVEESGTVITIDIPIIND